MDLRRRQENQQALLQGGPQTPLGARGGEGARDGQDHGAPPQGSRERREAPEGPEGPPIDAGGGRMGSLCRKGEAGPERGRSAVTERLWSRTDMGGLGGTRAAGRRNPAGTGRGLGLVLGYVLLLALSVREAGAANGDEAQAQYPGTNLGNRTDGPGFEVPPRPGSWIRRILPPELDPNEPIGSLNRRFEEARRGWRRTDPYYHFMPGDHWSSAPRRRGDRNEPRFPLIRIPEEQQGVRVPEEPDTWRAFTDRTLEPLFRSEIHVYTDALISDIDELAGRTPGFRGILRRREWRHRASQTEEFMVPNILTTAEALSILHRNHLQGPAPYVYYIPPRIWRPGHQADGFPREVQARAEPWRSHADHTMGAATALQTLGPGLVDIRNEAREEGSYPGPFASNNRDGSTQTPLEYDPRRRGSDQSYPFGDVRRVSGRLWERRSTGQLFIVPADPRSTRSGPLYDGFVEAGPAGGLWWEFQQQSALARMRARQDRAPPGYAAREPIGDGYSGDEEEERRTPHTVYEWSGAVDVSSVSDSDSDESSDS